jgi:HD-GYP domain-containing protein (c-di-GMP phosphodiesterase class II)
MMGLNSDMLEQLQMAVTLHDIGQIGIPHQILFKKGKLENAEYELIKTHPEIGHRILTKYQIEEEVVNAVKYHHEWYDGSGYPYGIKGQSIPLSARIISVLEAYDSMIQVSSYRKKKTPKKAIEELINFSGSQFDNEVVQSLKNMVINDDLVNKDALTSKNN